MAEQHEARFGVLTWISSSRDGDPCWYSHWRQHRLRARPLSPRCWVVSTEADGHWNYVGSGQTLGDASARAEQWAA